MSISRLVAATVAVITALTQTATADVRESDGLTAIWSNVELADLTPERAKALSKERPDGVRALFVPSGTATTADLGEGSLFAQLKAAGLVGSVDPQLAESLRRVPSGTPLTMLVSSSVGHPNGHVDTMDADDDDCVGAMACLTVSVSIEISAVRPQCAGPTIFGICVPNPAAPTPEFVYHTEQTADVVRIDGAIDKLTPSRPHFRSTSGGDWGHNFKVTLTNPNQMGAGAHYLAVADGEWAPVDLDTFSFPPGVTIEAGTTLISGFCLRWDVVYGDGDRGWRQDNFQLRGDVTLGAFTGHQWIRNEGICTL